MMKVFVWMALALSFVGSAMNSAQAAKVAIYGAPGDPTWNTDVQTKIASTGIFSQVDAFLASQTTPTLAQLQQYDAVLVYSDTGFANPTALGNVLADYSDGGGGVVIATFVFGGYLQGRFVSGGYLPFTNSGQNQGTPLTLVADLPTHPILAGVNSFNGGSSSYHNTIALDNGAVQVAHWNNGSPLVAARTPASGGIVAGLNFYPPSFDARADFWNTGTDGARLMANALLFTLSGIRGAQTTEGNGGAKTLDFPVTLKDPANGDAVITYSTADGTATVADNDYEPVINGTVTIPSGTKTGTISITINGDTVSEPNETFVVNITNVTNGSVSNTQGTGTIVNDDNDPPSFNAIADQQVDGPGPGAQLASVRFEWLTTCVNGDIRFYLNEVEVNAGENNTTNDCECTSFVDGFTTTDPAVLNAYSAGGDNVFRVLTPFTYYAWSRVVLTTTDGRTVTKPIYDYNGGNADVENLCDADYTAGVTDQSITYSGASLFASGYNVPITGISPGPSWEIDQGQTVSMTAVSNNPGLVPNPTISGNGTTRTLNYNPTSTGPGVAIITVTANDGQATHNTFSRTFKITVGNPNTAPVAEDQNLETNEDTAANGTLSATDVDGDALTYSIVANGSKGTATITDAATGAYTYTPNADANGTDSFTFKANDGTVDSNTATINVTINPVNDAPVAADGTLTTDEDTAANGTLSATDVDGDALTYSKVDDAAHGSVTVNADGSFIYTPEANYHGPDSFTFTASDGEATSNVATVSITVNSVNDAPVAVDDTATTPANTPVVIPVLDNDTDVDGDTLSVASFTQGSHGSVTQNADGTLTYTPYGVLGADSFSYEVSDGNGGTAEGSVAITVTLPASSTGANVTGGGGLDTEQGKPSFTVNAQVKKDGSVDGHFSYSDSPSGVYIRSTRITAVLVNTDGTIARIYAEATLNGAGTHALMVDLRDGGEPSSEGDYLRVTLDGVIVAEGALSRGNIQVHKVK